MEFDCANKNRLFYLTDLLIFMRRVKILAHQTPFRAQSCGSVAHQSPFEIFFIFTV
jgi:hypothetical protein